LFGLECSRLGFLPLAGIEKKESEMSEWAPVAAAAITGSAAIVCEIIRNRSSADERSRKRQRGLAKIPIKPVILAAEAKRFMELNRLLKRSRNLALILFAASVAIEISLSPFGTRFLSHQWSDLGTPVTGIHIEITQIPPAGEGGPNEMGHIAGKVSGVKPEDLRREDFRVVVYAHTARADLWYVQPYIAYPFTGINSGGTWENDTHFGDRYAALLVKPSFRPPQITDALPNIGGDVIATTNMAPMP
jgi:hypothetical protein